MGRRMRCRHFGSGLDWAGGAFGYDYRLNRKEWFGRMWELKLIYRDRDVQKVIFVRTLVLCTDAA